MQERSPALESWLAGAGVDALVPHLRLSRVRVDAKCRRALFLLDCDELPGEKDASAIRRALRKKVPGLDVSVRLCCPSLGESFLADPGRFTKLLTQHMVGQFPGAAPWMARSEWRMEGEELVLSLESGAGVQFLRARQADRVLERTIEDVFHVRVKTRLEVAGELAQRFEELARERAEREAEIVRAQLAARTVTERKPDTAKPLYGKAFQGKPVPIQTLTDESGRVVVEGKVLRTDSRTLRGNQKTLWLFDVTDLHGSIACKVFLENDNLAPMRLLHAGDWVRLRGDCVFDKFAQEVVLMVNDILPAADPTKREDGAEEKRVELHLHTQMSNMDGAASPKSLIQRAAAWGHKAIAITDHGVLQSYPEAFDTARKAGIKFIPGLEGYLVDDSLQTVIHATGEALTAPIIVVDVETTGLNTARDEITEIGAVRIEGGRIVDEFGTLVNPGRAIPAEVVKLTGITDAMVQDAPRINEAIVQLAEFCQGAVALAAHNARFDSAFLQRAAEGANVSLPASTLDTLSLSRSLLPELKSHKLGAICKALGVSLVHAHRAVDDARATAQALNLLLARLRERGIETFERINTEFAGGYNARRTNHIILLARTQEGLENLYRLVSEAHLHHFHRFPLLPRSLIQRHREGLIIGSACEAGELFRAMLDGATDSQLESIARFYDYLEIQPIGNNDFLRRTGRVEDEEALRELNRRIVALGERCGLPVVATGDVHFLDPEDSIYRAILMAGMGFEDASEQAPLYFRTTEDMLQEFAYLGEETAREVVIRAPVRIAESVEAIRMFPKHPKDEETFQPNIPDAEEDIRRMAWEEARRIYGDPVPEIIQARLDKELQSICGYGFATLYRSAQLLVQKSLSGGYLVGSRGSVGSSFVATMTGITEVNPLPPHYVCPECCYSDFEIDTEQWPCGIDLPERECPVCGARLRSDGYDIPFEVFLGFKGDKVPDIDLNFSGVYQPKAHAYVETLFGKDHVFRAGTIGTIAEKTAYGYVVKYLEERGIHASKVEIQRLAQGCTGTKRTTGQHPGGMVVLPEGYRITQFTPIQHPADDKESEIVTTHFDFGSLHDILVKLDILGHDDPTMIRMLEDLTGVNARKIPLDDPVVMSLFTGTDALGVTPEQIGTDKGTLGIPEFGTKFVRQMLEDTMPTTMAELLRISGLSHGTDVWLGNAQDLIREGVATLKQCICTRDDIMNFLIQQGVESKMSFTTMESVRKGKGLTADMEAAMRQANVPEWFIDSCKKIKYMFPRAHAAAYVMMALRIAWFKVNRPVEYYTAYFTIRATAFDAAKMLVDADALRKQIEAVEALGKGASAKDKDMQTVMELVLEMRMRGIEFLPIDLYRSSAATFQIEDGKIRPPLNSLAGVGDTAAQAIVKAREEGPPFLSIEDISRRARVSRAVIDALREMGVLAGLSDTSQMTLFV